MEIGIQALGVLALEPDNNEDLGFKAIAEAGFDGVDLSLESFYDTRSIADPSIPCFYDRPIEELKSFFEPYVRECARNGLKFIQSHAPFHHYLADVDAWAHYKEIIKKSVEAAGFLDIPYITVHPVVSSGVLDAEQGFKLSRELFDELIPVAKGNRVCICIENLFDLVNGRAVSCPCSEAEELCSMIDGLNNEAGEHLFYACLDIGHATLLQHDIRDMINKLGDRVAITHLHDNDGMADKHVLPFTEIPHWGGRFSVDWSGLIEGLKEIGYRGTLDFETAGIMLAMPQGLKPAALKYVAETGRYLKGAINGDFDQRSACRAAGGQ